jgi:hypothetical protein
MIVPADLSFLSSHNTAEGNRLLDFVEFVLRY